MCYFPEQFQFGITSFNFTYRITLSLHQIQGQKNPEAIFEPRQLVVIATAELLSRHMEHVNPGI